MNDKLKELSQEIESFVAETQDQLEEYRLRFIGRKNVIADLFSEMRHVPNEEKKAFGQAVNDLKNLAKDKFQELIDGLSSKSSTSEKHPDLTLPPVSGEFGSIHPLTATRNRFIQIFERIGFNVSSGPEI
ncbi:MAG: phenylalanine--tRNA ligase subunit alpha, partial [Cytophagia bacterium]|nr:phenylalanine--tRNA ligase subunit alpha [Cytophagia bacterium]